MTKKIINDFLNYRVIYLFLMLYFCYDSNVTILRLGHHNSILYSSIITFIFLCVAFFKKEFKFNAKAFLLFLLLLLVSIISGMIFNTNFNTIMYFSIIYFIAFISSCIFTKENFISSFVLCMVIVCIFSLLTQYILYPLFKNGIKFGEIYVIRNQLWPITDLYLGFSVISSGIQRIYSFFREPGVFQFFIILALFFVFFRYDGSKYFRLLISLFLITLLGTFSTAGLLFGLLILLLALFNKKTKNKYKILIIVLIITFALLVVLFNNDSFLLKISLMINKLIQNTNNESFSVRFYSFINIFKASLNHPIFGMGFDNGLNYIIQNLNQFGTNDVTGTLMVIAVAYGWPICLLCNILFFRLVFYFKNKSNLFILFCIWLALFLSLNTQNMLYDSIIWMLLFFDLYINGGNTIEKRN